MGLLDRIQESGAAVAEAGTTAADVRPAQALAGALETGLGDAGGTVRNLASGSAIDRLDLTTTGSGRNYEPPKGNIDTGNIDPAVYDEVQGKALLSPDGTFTTGEHDSDPRLAALGAIDFNAAAQVGERNRNERAAQGRENGPAETGVPSPNSIPSPDAHLPTRDVPPILSRRAEPHGPQEADSKASDQDIDPSVATVGSDGIGTSGTEAATGDENRDDSGERNSPAGATVDAEAERAPEITQEERERIYDDPSEDPALQELWTKRQELIDKGATQEELASLYKDFIREYPDKAKAPEYRDEDRNIEIVADNQALDELHTMQEAFFKANQGKSRNEIDDTELRQAFDRFVQAAPGLAQAIHGENPDPYLQDSLIRAGLLEAPQNATQGSPAIGSTGKEVQSPSGGSVAQAGAGTENQPGTAAAASGTGPEQTGQGGAAPGGAETADASQGPENQAQAAQPPTAEAQRQKTIAEIISKQPITQEQLLILNRLQAEQEVLQKAQQGIELSPEERTILERVQVTDGLTNRIAALESQNPQDAQLNALKDRSHEINTLLNKNRSPEEEGKLQGLLQQEANEHRVEQIKTLEGMSSRTPQQEADLRKLKAEQAKVETAENRSNEIARLEDLRKTQGFLSREDTQKLNKLYTEQREDIESNGDMEKRQQFLEGKMKRVGLTEDEEMELSEIYEGRNTEQSLEQIRGKVDALALDIEKRLASGQEVTEADLEELKRLRGQEILMENGFNSESAQKAIEAAMRGKRQGTPDRLRRRNKNIEEKIHRMMAEMMQLRTYPDVVKQLRKQKSDAQREANEYHNKAAGAMNEAEHMKFKQLEYGVMLRINGINDRIIEAKYHAQLMMASIHAAEAYVRRKLGITSGFRALGEWVGAKADLILTEVNVAAASTLDSAFGVY